MYQKEIVFYKSWFVRNQKRLLRFANSRIGRYVLRIYGKRSSVGKKKIIRIEPHAITWKNNNGTFSTEFRTHAKFAKRLYYAFRPFWKLLHIWDILIANNIAPQLNVGFDTFHPDSNPETNSADGYAVQIYGTGFGVDFSVIRAGDGSSGSASGTGLYNYVQADTVSNKWQLLYRSIILFYTASLPDTASISSATLSLYGDSFTNNLGWSNAEAGVSIVTSDPASDTDVVAGDYNSLGTIRQANDITFDNLVTNYNDFVFNSIGLSNISKTECSKFGSRVAFDTDGGSPNWISSQIVNLQFYAAERTGTSQDPKLVVSYILTKTCTTKADIWAANIRTSIAKGNIETIVVRTLTCKARITANRTTTCKARIETSMTQTLTCKARIEILNITETVTIKARIQRKYIKTLTCKARIGIVGIEHILTVKANIYIWTIKPIIGGLLVPSPSAANIIPLWQKRDHITLDGTTRREQILRKYRYTLSWDYMTVTNYDALEAKVNGSQPFIFIYEKWPQSSLTGVSVLAELSPRRLEYGTGDTHYLSSVTLTLTESSSRA